MVKIHNKIFEGKSTNIIEFGTDRGGTLTTISKFIKNNSKISPISRKSMLDFLSWHYP